ncbi:MAG: alpha/beta hydrolase [Niabella sp.]
MMKKQSYHIRHITAMVIACLFIGNLSAQSKDSMVYKPVECPPGFTSQLDVVYTKAAGWEGKMDIYLPPKGKTPVPLAISIHGGGWNHGTKEVVNRFNLFFDRGYAVANIEYRLTGQATAPAAVEDTRSALIYLIQHAQQLNIDIHKIVLVGSSAGGHLALMGGLLGNDHRFDTHCAGVVPVKVAAIIDNYGITDVWDWGYGVARSHSAINWLGDKAKDHDFAMSVSPLSYINKNSPPVFIVHGDADAVVPYQQSQELHKKLLASGVKTRFITVPGGHHGKFTAEQNSGINKEIIRFLKELHL